MSYENPTNTEKALYLAYRCTEYRLWKSMTELRKMIRKLLKSEGLEKEMRNFKLKKAGENHVIVYLRPGVEVTVKVEDL